MKLFRRLWDQLTEPTKDVKLVSAFTEETERVDSQKNKFLFEDYCSVDCSVDEGVITLREEIYGRTIKKVLDTEDKMIRNALISLGWIPPLTKNEHEQIYSEQ